MKKIFAIVFIALMATSCYEEQELLELSGKLKSVKVYYEKEKITERRTYHYTSFGAVSREQRFFPEGEEAGEINYFYNDEQQLVEVISTIHGDQYEAYYTYDEKGRLASISGSGKADMSEYIYDQYDRLIEKRGYHYINQEKQYSTRNIYIYDDDYFDRVIEEAFFAVDNGDLSVIELQEKLQYIYDNDGRLIQKKLIDGRNIYYRGTKELFQYDSKGRRFKKLEYGLDLYFSHSFGLMSTTTYYYYE
jgi:hypothetical protein